MDRPLKVAVVGGGPAGLVTLKFLATAHHYFRVPPIQVRCFEAEADIGGIFTHRVYEDAEMVSSRYLTCFSDFRTSRDAPDFLCPEAYVQYLKDYVQAFDLLQHIELSTKVVNISRGPDGRGHILEISKDNGDSTSNWNCDAVAVCSGVHVKPYIPQIPGIERVPISFHSYSMKTRSQFGPNTNVVVLGCGETGMDVAHLAITSPTRSVTLCSRDGFFCAPKIVATPSVFGSPVPTHPNKPVDTSVASLFDTAYLHPLLQRGPLTWIAYDQWVRKTHWLISGTEEGPDQWAGHISQERKNLSSIFLCKSDRALPYISDGKRSNSLVNRIRTKIINVPIQDTKGRRIDVKGWPTEVDEDGIVRFRDDSEPIRADVVVFATGYTAEMSYLSPDYPALKDLDVRNIYKEGDVSVGFIGFIRPSIGAIPPLAELQAQLWIYRLLQDRFPKAMPPPGPDSIPSYDIDYLMKPRCGYDFASTKRGVDHEAYAYQLALDMGAAPTISYVAKQGWKVFFTWAMGSNFNTKFRMVGPWKREAEAARIMRGELFDVVKRSGGGFYLVTYSLIPFVIFGALSLLLYSVGGLLSMSRRMGFWISRLLSRLRRGFSNEYSKLTNEERGASRRDD